MGKTLVENLRSEKFDPGQYSDSYAKELEKLIEAKSKTQRDMAIAAGVTEVTIRNRIRALAKDLNLSMV